MYASPGAKIITVYQTNNYNLLPIYSSFMALISATCWLMYGIYLKDSNIIIPNSFGVFFGLMQVIVFYIALNRAKKHGIRDAGKLDEDKQWREDILDSKEDSPAQN